MAPPITDLSGRTFGRLTVLHRVNRGTRYVEYLCQCTCGTQRVVAQGNLKSGNTVSCGCDNKTRNIAHGMTGTPEFRAWDNAIQRCYNAYNKDYHNYGGRGITVCDRWRNSFEAFYQDMGKKPSPDMSLDRIDNDGNYSPDNCRWATRVQQQGNRRNTPCKV